MYQVENADIAYGMFELYYNKYEHTKKLLNKRNKKIRELKQRIKVLESQLPNNRNVYFHKDKQISVWEYYLNKKKDGERVDDSKSRTDI